MKHEPITTTSPTKRAWSTPQLVALSATPELIELIRSRSPGGAEAKTST